MVKLDGDPSVERVIDIGFSAHSFFQDGRHPERIWAVEKWGKRAAVVDIKAGWRCSLKPTRNVSQTAATAMRAGITKSLIIGDD